MSKSNFFGYIGSSPLLASVFDYFGNRSVTDLSNRNVELAEDKAFYRNAQYNHPASQMQRLKEAGLNPNLVYGTGVVGATGNTHASIHNRQAYDQPNSAQKYLTYQSMQLNNEISRRTAKNLDAQNSFLQAQTQEARARADAQLYENRILFGTGSSRNDPFYARLSGRLFENWKDNVGRGVKRFPLFDTPEQTRLREELFQDYLRGKNRGFVK